MCKNGRLPMHRGGASTQKFIPKCAQNALFFGKKTKKSPLRWPSASTSRWALTPDPFVTPIICYSYFSRAHFVYYAKLINYRKRTKVEITNALLFQFFTSISAILVDRWGGGTQKYFLPPGEESSSYAIGSDFTASLKLQPTN